jgi:type I restriction enzyme S subunit
MVNYPSDWKISQIDKIASITTGCRDVKDSIRNGRYPFYVRSKEVERINFDDFNCEAVLTAGDGGAGKIFHYINGKFAAHQRVYVISKFEEVDGKYFYYFFSKNFLQEVEKYTAKSTVDSVRRPMIANMEFPLPTLKEQRAIASVLSDFDQHIDNLTELIEKKKAIRDGALEDLLSGRTRLDGFNGEWISIKLSDFAQINPSSLLPEVFKYVDLESVKGISLMSWRFERKETAPSRAKRLAQHGDIFFQTVRPYQRNNYLFELPDEDVVFSTGYAQLRTGNNARFLFLLLRQDSFVNEVLDNCTGTSYPAINPSKLADIKIYVPVDVYEQEAIAQVVTAMDREIGDLETEKAKFVQIREGVMNELLTGRVRLKV